MVTNFENYTCELSEDELKLVDPIIKGLLGKTKQNPIKAPQIIIQMNLFCQKKGFIKLTEPRLRKIINHIRSNGMLPVIATSNGYYVSYNKKDIQEQIDSLSQRANSIIKCTEGLSFILKHIEEKNVR